MNGLDLLRSLRDSGTGEAKLQIGIEALRRTRNASDIDVLAALAQRPDRVGETTLRKCKNIVAGRHPDWTDPATEQDIFSGLMSEHDLAEAGKRLMDKPAVVVEPDDGRARVNASVPAEPPKAESVVIPVMTPVKEMDNPGIRPQQMPMPARKK